MNERSPRFAPIARLPFLAWGLGLFALKIAADYAVAHAFGREFSPLHYVSPRDAALFRPGDDLAYWLVLWAVALPFLVGGVWFCLRRLVDARLPPWLIALFFVPFANLLFFLMLAVAPTGVGNAGAPTASGRPQTSKGGAILIGGAAGAVIALGSVALSVGVLRAYGAALFVGAPTVAGFMAAMIFARLHGPSLAGSLGATFLATVLSMGVMVLFAIEGLVCLAMAAPLALVGAAGGWLVAHLLASYFDRPPPAATPAAFALVPLWLAIEALVPTGAPQEQVVESVVDIDAPTDVVWERVIAFPDLPPPTELAFRAGVAAPTGAVIEGEGVGAVRRCRFTTGEFVEPITVWEPGRELAFDVVEQPDPMREMTPFEGPRPPHLDGYFATTRGQFELEALPDGRTRLHGRTWYRLDIAPQRYWSVWTDRLVHQIHLRVMNHVARLAEADAAGAT